MIVNRFEIAKHGVNDVQMPSGTKLVKLVIDPNGVVKVIGICDMKNPAVNRRILMVFEGVDFPLGFSEASYVGGFDVPTKVHGQNALVHVHCLDAGESGLILQG